MKSDIAIFIILRAMYVKKRSISHLDTSDYQNLSFAKTKQWMCVHMNEMLLFMVCFTFCHLSLFQG
jgi:hypothetical protein